MPFARRLATLTNFKFSARRCWHFSVLWNRYGHIYNWAPSQISSSMVKHAHIFPPTELSTMRHSVTMMVSSLDNACHQSTSSPDDAHPRVVARVSTGRRGRPHIQIDPYVLHEALTFRGPTKLASLFNCSSRTVRQRALDLGLSQPGVPVFTEEQTAQGDIRRSYAPPAPRVSTISDDQLNGLLTDLLQTFLKFGRCMITGWLHTNGHRVPQTRITAAYARVHGAPGLFGDHTIHRKTYHVAGANSLWYHDGQHGEHQVEF